MEEEKTKLDVKQQALPGKKRLAHEAKRIEVLAHVMADVGGGTPELEGNTLTKAKKMNSN